MAWQSNKPIATDDLGISAPEILGNFTALGTMMFPDQGQINFPANTGRATAATTVGLMAKASVEIPARTALFFVPDTGAGTNPVDFTTSVHGATGWCRLPSGIMLQWGSGTAGAGVDWLDQPLLIPFTNFWSVTVSPNNLPAGLNDDNIICAYVHDVSHFWVGRKTHFGSACSFNYFAIGD